MNREERGNFFKRRERFIQNPSKTSVRLVLSYLWDYKFRFILISGLGILQSALFLTIPLFLGPSLDILVNPANSIEEVYPLFLLMILIQVFVAILAGIRIWINRWVGTNIIYRLRTDLFSTIQLMSFSWLDSHKTGDLLSRTTSDVNLLKEFLGNNLQMFIRQFVTFSLSFVIMFIINVELAFYVLSISPALFYVLFVFRKKMRPAFKKSRETYSDLTHDIQENVQGIKVVKSFARENHEISQFTDLNDEYYKDSIKIIKIQATFDPLIYLIDNAAFLIVLLLGSLFVYNDSITFGALFAFILVMNFSVEPLYFITRFLANMPQISEVSERIASILTSKIEVKEKPHATVMPSINGVVEFRNVSFKYNHENKKYILNNINFKTKPGETVAILGGTGSGKSTFVKMIPRFYDVNEGEILIDGVNIQDVTLKSLRKQIGYVSQERILFSRSIKENIAFGNRNLEEEEIRNAANIADINEFIENELPKKYGTKVGERGMTLSGGQKQRVAIARALAVKPRILLLDDCFSSVDVDTEYEIQKKLKDAIKNTTTFLITQRLSTVRHADRILVMEDGEIIQSGTHQELINQKGGVYRKLYLTLEVEGISK
ncbi:MAG: ATP-binding cassette domain-containing protein [Candidatus Lokiarchaeota archaeon]|nr:ATP-binding cassette domain-containing protein [Candidatus Lokiarchaeota archaeon]MBD3199378.1 ATP-binding cassette domain-containing protein [Candidatus Lokiarchaeota archaeon]